MRSSRFAVIPLWVMAAAFVLPAYRACSDDPAHSALQYASDSPFMATWVTPPFLFAGVFAVLTTLALLRGGQVSLRTRRIGLAALGVFAALSLTVSSIWAIQDNFEWPWLAAGIGSVVAAAALVRRARGHEPWRIWQHEVGAFALIGAGAGPSIFLAVDAVTKQNHIAWGGWLYLAALASLLVLAVRVALQGASKSESSPKR
jgi:hypothetical protein